jgi:hypothetical protein
MNPYFHGITVIYSHIGNETSGTRRKEYTARGAHKWPWDHVLTEVWYIFYIYLISLLVRSCSCETPNSKKDLGTWSTFSLKNSKWYCSITSTALEKYHREPKKCEWHGGMANWKEMMHWKESKTFFQLICQAHSCHQQCFCLMNFQSHVLLLHGSPWLIRNDITAGPSHPWQKILGEDSQKTPR